MRVLKQKNNGINKSGILIVDDERTVMDSLNRILQVLGYNVYTARSGRDGLKTFQKNKESIKLILSDMLMPGFSGKDLFYEIKKVDKKIKFVIVSAFSASQEVSQMMKDGLDGFLQKPFSLDNLKSVLSQLLPKGK